MSQEKTTISLATPPIDNNAVYMVDFSKMGSVEDLVTILACLGLSFSPMHPQFELVKKFLDLNNPLPTGMPKQEEVKLPKMKKL